MSIKEDLYKWRDSEAEKKGIDGFRVLPNQTLDQIAIARPFDKDSLCAIKGIKDMKFAQYGKEILDIVQNGYIEKTKEENSESKEEVNFISISEYLNILNKNISNLKYSVKGEVTSFDERSNAIYFSIKDNDSMMSVFMWSRDYLISGVKVEVGTEVIVTGYPEVYKPNGRLSFKAQNIEYSGEGALKKAYEELKGKLDKEGLFAPDKKRKLKDFPSKIGVITSKQGAVIHDFLNNLGKNGFQIQFIDSRVEGVLAITDLLLSLKTMSKLDIDALVVIRGGGSLESLQAFNNEHVVRAISDFKVPVICAIGHDKDIPLSQLAADYAPSTPSMCTAILNNSYIEAKYNVSIYKKSIISDFSSILNNKKNTVEKAHLYLNKQFDKIKNNLLSSISNFNIVISNFENTIESKRREVDNIKGNIKSQYLNILDKVTEKIKYYDSVIDAYNPIKRLKIGYSILYNGNKIIKSISEVEVGDTIKANVSDGLIEAIVKNTNIYDKENN